MTLPAARRRLDHSVRSLESETIGLVYELQLEARTLSWPASKYQGDPVGFCRDILGIELWEKQVEIAESVRDNPNTSVKSGHRIGKSTIAAALALWFWASFPDARIVMTAPVARQVQDILWRAVRMLYERAGRCVACKADGENGPKPCEHSALLDGELAERASTGLVSANFREIRGYTARDVEAITGTAGAYMLFILDEASGIADAIYQGLEGNRAGWSADDAGTMVRLLLIGNPTRTSGEFYDSHEHPKKKKLYHQITVSSRETPNAKLGRVVIPALATRDWIAQMEAKYGADSAFVKVRVDGVFPIGEDGKAFSIHFITQSQQRRDEASQDGPLYIGIDPSGESGTGDDAAFSARRALKQIGLRTFLGLSPEAHYRELERMVLDHRAYPGERAIVVLDAEGPIGTKVRAHLATMARKRDAIFELHCVRASDTAWREPLTYGTVRDELAMNLWRWMKEGGAIVDDDELLERELHVLEWERVAGKSKITPKKKIRAELGRSPDRYDATALSVWEPAAASARSQNDHDTDEDDDDLDGGGGGIDPYRGGIDPYGGA